MFLRGCRTILLSSSLHQRLVAIHAKDSLRRPGIAQILDFPFAVPASKALGTESLFAGQDGQILDLVPT
jgi:hypothetical protein